MCTSPIDADEFYRLLEGVTIDDTNIFNARLKEWQDYYNTTADAS